mmetsp:Transcript_123428/g.308420  ORF Transcript_123428/g.308420 Transcript_123428/m.308420 type:complete len:117 (+) Transcript_123428:363-713(+)
MLSHTLQFAILLAMFTNLTQHTLYLCWQRRRWPSVSHYIRYGPAYTVAAATLLIMIHPTYTVLKMGKQIEKVSTPWTYALHGCTLAGYTLLCAGALWAADFWAKWKHLFPREGRDL